MFILLVMLAIVLVWLLILSREKVAPINTALFHGSAPAVQTPAPEPATEAVPETQPETPAPEVQPETPAPEAPAPEPQPETPAPEPQPETPAPAPAVSGTLVDTGVIRTMCPDGWLYIEQRDVFGTKDENGNYPLDPKQMCFCKGAQTEMDVFSKLSVYAYYEDQPFSQAVVDSNSVWYSETEPFTCTINGTECQGFHAKEEDIFTEGQFYEYDFIFLPINDAHHVMFRIMTSVPGSSEVLTRNDADVQLILTSMAAD